MSLRQAVTDPIEDILDRVEHGFIAGPVIKQYLTTEFDKFCKD